MESGYVVLQIITLLLIGVAGSGKTSFLHYILGLPPPASRESTPLAKSAIRTVSIKHATATKDDATWCPVSSADFLSMLASLIRGHDPPPSIPASIRDNTVRHGILQERLLRMVNSFKARFQLRLQPPPSSRTTTVVDDTLQRESYELQPMANQSSVPKSSQPSVEQLYTPSLPSKNVSSYDNLTQKKVVQDLLRILDTSKGGEAFNEQWVHLVDSGGQPQYHELLPTFVHDVSGAAIFVKLNEELDSNPMIAHFAEGHLSGVAYSSSQTHMQIIQNCLQVLQSRNSKTKCPRLFFIGTHRDLEGLCSENKESKNEQLLQMLHRCETLKDNYSLHCLGTPDELMYVVNTGDPQDQDYQVLDKFRRAVLSQCKAIERKIEIPLRWFIFERLLEQVSQDKGRYVLGFADCQRVAIDCQMNDEELNAVLHFLARFNIFNFFPKVLPGIIFTTSQVLLDKVSELVEYSHSLQGPPDHNLSKQSHCSEAVQFREYATVTAEFLEQFPQHYEPGLFTPTELLKILNNQLVFAHTETANKYFMPSVLPELSVSDLSKHRIDLVETTTVSALLVYTSSGLIPAGNFSGLISYLQNRSRLRVSKKLYMPTCLKKNCVRLSYCEFAATITLIYTIDYIEVYVQAPPELYPKVCPQIKSMILDGLEEVRNIQQCEHIHYKTGLFCSCDNSHTSPHIAKLCDPIGNCLLQCYCSEDDTNFREITAKELVWLGVNLSPHRNSHGMIPLDFYRLEHMKINGDTVNIIESVAPHWESMCSLLHIEPYVRETIKQGTFHQPVDACRLMFNKWLEGRGREPKSWETLITALRECNLVTLAGKVENMVGSY